ncbi:hypothetical protein [Nocardia sp. alder85J]|uniref:hypothetical protein n=1 Tax=Nocardia sp. alder85J TaxID=2862949 RepID=UPI001CD543D3|nr:hypothetical protein [Nocardia sp. alder85J]MCX4093910.1 hypothetical protein [Nocardia sp. alder85J]
MLLQIGFIVVLAGVVVALITQYRRGRTGGGRGAGRSWRNPPAVESGTLYVTGVSPRPAAQGEQFVTLTGTVSGPSVAGETVYGRFVWDVGQWPSPGDQFPVVYPPGKPDRWQIEHPGARPLFG